MLVIIGTLAVLMIIAFQRLDQLDTYEQARAQYKRHLEKLPYEERLKETQALALEVITDETARLNSTMNDLQDSMRNAGLPVDRSERSQRARDILQKYLTTQPSTAPTTKSSDD